MARDLRHRARALEGPILPALPAVVVAAVLTAACGLAWAGEEAESLDRRIERLIGELGHEKYTVRERAQKELAELGYEAYDALSAAANHDDLEIATRARYLLQLIPAQWNLENEPPLVRDYLAYYESGSPEQRSIILNELARMSQGGGPAALCRLVRFEKSALWSKQAAVALMYWEPVGEAGRARWAKTLREQLGRSARPGAQWLGNYLRFRDDPQEAVSQWDELIREEERALRRFAEQSDPSIVAALLYLKALAQAELGDEAASDETAKRARQFNQSRTSAQLRARIDVAQALAQRGRFRWAAWEFRHVLDAGAAYPKVRAGVLFSETLHDQGDNLAAAKVLDEVLQVDKRELDSVLDLMSRTGGELRARMAYFLACHWQEQGDRAQQRQYLDEAVQHDPSELDALIARYHLPDKEPEFHQKTLELVERAASSYRQELAETPDDAPQKAGLCNQLAWLVGNTEGDLDEALQCARKAVELRPDAGAYLDTLAHVYFARGELSSAVETQLKAAQQDPHSGLIAKKLAVFQDALKRSTEGRSREPAEGEAAESQAAKSPPESGKPKPE